MNTIPSHDVALRRVVDRATATQPSGTPAELAARLRPLYPRIAVFERQLSGDLAHLYVYRDGRYEPERPDAWWTAPDAPRVRVSSRTGLLRSVTGRWAALMRADPGSLVGRHFLDFVLPEARSVAEAMFDAVTGEREVRSEALLVRGDGTTVPLEFRATQRDGEIEIAYRPLDASA